MKMHSRFGILIALLLILTGCNKFLGGARAPGDIPFILTGVERGACPMGVKIGRDKWQLDYFAFYLSEPELRIDGKWQPVKFTQTEWQTPSTALLQFHSLCSNPDDANTKITLDVSEKLLKLATNLRFSMGLPFDVNHANPLAQPAPLNYPAMSYNMQNGHRFMRLDLSNTSDNNQRWSYHLGSAGCESAGPDVAPEKSCTFTNRVEFILPMTQLDTDLDLALSVSNIVSQVFIADSADCKFESPEKRPCKQLLRNLLQRPWIQWD